jgi:hypothetical protein
MDNIFKLIEEIINLRNSPNMPRTPIRTNLKPYKPIPYKPININTKPILNNNNLSNNLNRPVNNNNLNKPTMSTPNNTQRF